MKYLFFLFAMTTLITSNAQDSSLVDYSGFMAMTDEVHEYRASRLISIDTFNLYSKEEGTIILDTRSKKAFDEVHIAGSVHLNFSDFTTAKLAKVIPNLNTRILIYCNNNFDEPDFAALTAKSTPLALNIPTFINLYGYGYKNVYELRDLVTKTDPRIKLEGTKVPKVEMGKATK